MGVVLLTNVGHVWKPMAITRRAVGENQLRQLFQQQYEKFDTNRSGRLRLCVRS